MRKIFLAICLCAGLAACGNGNNNTTHTDNNSPAFTDTSGTTSGNIGTPAKQNGDTTIDSTHRAGHVPSNSSGKTKNTNPDTTNASSH